MAKPIKETPVLKGKDARVFIDKMKKADSIRVSSAEKARIRRNYALVNSIVKF